MERKSPFSEFHDQFSKMDFGTLVSTNDYQVITLKIDPKFMIGEYADAFAKDLHRRNPLRYEAIEKQLSQLMNEKDEAHESGLVKDIQVGTFSEEIEYYVIGLLKLRVQVVYDECREWRRAKRLGIPPYIQFVLSMVGRVIDTTHGRKFVPEIDELSEFDMNRLLRISSILRTFEDDGVVLLFDSMPRSKDGDADAMSYAIIDSYVKGIDRTEVAKSYVSAFLGMKLKKESEFKAIYSVRYDNADFVKDCLIDELTK